MSEQPFDHEVEMYTLPSLEDEAYWERVIAAGLDGPIAATNGGHPNGDDSEPDSWHRIDLLADELRVPPQPPIIHGLLYADKRHAISGPPESAKTLVAYILLLAALRQDHGVAIIDMEMGPHAAVTMLREIGATDDEIGQILFFEPLHEPPVHLAEQLVTHGVSFVLIDAAAGAYDLSGLNDNHRQEVEMFAARWIRPLRRAGISTIVIDHVTKNADSRGKFTIGSERKTGQADVHLGLEAIKTLSRGSTGLLKVTNHKDRPGWLDTPTIGYFELESNPDTHRITWAFREAEHHAPDDDFRPTALMEKVSRWLEDQGGAHSGNQIEKAKLGKNDYVRKAIKVLVQERFVTQNETGRGYEYRHASPFRKTDDLAPENTSVQAVTHLAPTSPHLAPGAVEMTSPLAPPSIEGGEGAKSATSPPKININDPAIQALLDE